MHGLKRVFLVGALACSGLASATPIKIATVAPDGTAWMREMRTAADAIKKGTDGRVEIKYYPGGVMGDASTVLRKIKIGQLQGGAFTGGEATVITPDAQVYSLPFLYRGEDEVGKVRAKLDPLVKQSFDAAGYDLVGIAGGGFAYLFSTRDIKTRDGLKAAKVWVPQGDKAAEVTFKVAGVTPIPLPLSDVYTSLQTGLIDTAASTPSGAIAFQWHTKVKHMVDLPLSYVVGEVVVDKKATDALSATDRKVFDDAFAAGFARLEKTNIQDNASAREALKQQGITFTEPSDAERRNWEAVGTEAFKELSARGGITPAMLKALNETLAEIRGNAK
ncbi:MAG TPA: TRAP transporter substrate-binding protein DctP [Rhodanobacteraceae bacterium]|jgi:TRAP-type C4-dicarboxylate transport system substrate-binding protein|nr:TRAP transporter substrate-binding protein DctP [Rhodanobacteraceae bacterium]